MKVPSVAEESVHHTKAPAQGLKQALISNLGFTHTHAPAGVPQVSWASPTMGFFPNYLLRSSPSSGVGGSRGKLGEETVLPFGDGDRRTAENTHT